MDTTNVPVPSFTPAGLAVPAAQDVFAGVQADWVGAFALVGKTLGTGLTTAQGQLQQSQAYMLTQAYALMAGLIANVDPITSQGAFQDALGRIYFLTRQDATFATVSATVSGTVGQLLPAGAQARSQTDGTLWTTQNDVTFGSAGTATVTFQATVAGASPTAAVGALRIYQQLPGWEGVNNTVASSPGVDVEGRQSFEQRRADSVSIGGIGTANAVRAAVANVDGVSDVYVYNNGSDAAITYGATNYPIPAHSIAVCVTGGTDAAVATAINAKLDCGCGLPTAAGQGALVSYTVQDTVNYEPPYPAYQVRFVRAAAKQVYLTIQVANLPTLPANYQTLVQNAVAAAFANGYLSPDGTISLPRARLGAELVAAGLAAPILALGNITPVSLFISYTALPSSGASVTLGIDQQPVCGVGNINVVAVSV